MFVHRTKKLLVRSTIVGSYLIIFPLANRVDPDQSALIRAARSGSGLFAKASKCASMRLRVNAGQKYCIKLPFVIKIFVLSFIEWPFYTGFSLLVSRISASSPRFSGPIIA